ncbi:hypothetical protein D9M68_354170 [compost metagenome]
MTAERVFSKVCTVAPPGEPPRSEGLYRVFSDDSGAASQSGSGRRGAGFHSGSGWEAVPSREEHDR